ncbi:TPA: hypothetical protein NJY08_004387 [Salmonella enterica subsp. enterica serovar Typhi str. AG3]|nr:hypothetical protein [Salmonella enterica subsp. enterica serovar Typhi str. AG3]
MKDALNKILELRYRCKRQKTISTHLILDDLLIIEKAMHDANKTYNALNKRAQRAETEVKQLKARLRKLENG